jgi:hypothetical protein
MAFSNSNGIAFQFNNNRSTFSLPVILSTITFSDGTSQYTAGGKRFSWEPGILSGKLVSPGTTNFPSLDNSTTTAQQSLFWDSITTQTITWQKVLRPYGGTNPSIDFYFTGSSVTTGNVAWGYSAVCTGPTHSISANNVWNSYSVAASTGGAIPSTAGNPAVLSLANQALSNCIEGDVLNLLVTRYHNIASDAQGDIRLTDVVFHEN